MVRGRQLPGKSEEPSTSTEAGCAGGAGGRTEARWLQCAGVQLLSVPRPSSGYVSQPTHVSVIVEHVQVGEGGRRQSARRSAATQRAARAATRLP